MGDTYAGNNVWHRHLIERGASFDEHGILHWRGDGLQPGSTALVPLVQWGAIRISGPDAADFLHAQLANDVHGITAGDSRLQAYCAPDGRVLALLRLIALPDGAWLAVLSRDLLATLAQRLRLHVLRADVSLEPLGEQWQVLGVVGPRAEHTLATAGLDIPPEAGRVAGASEDAIVVCIDSTTPRYAIVGADEPLVRLWDRLAEAGPAAPEAWIRADIRAGLVDVDASSSGRFLPQELNLDRIGAVSFGKGCYPGQEVIARLHYLGRTKRRVWRLRCAAGVPVQGAPVLGADERHVGEVLVAAGMGDGSGEALAVLHRDAWEAETLYVDAGTRLAAQRCELPYTVHAER